MVEDKITNINPTNHFGAILALNQSTNTQNDYLMNAQKARTGWVIRQHLGAYGTYNPKEMDKLFRIAQSCCQF